MDSTSKSLLLVGGGAAALFGVYYFMTRKPASVQAATYVAPAKPSPSIVYDASVAAAQKMLAGYGYNVGAIDGQMGAGHRRSPQAISGRPRPACDGRRRRGRAASAERPRRLPGRRSLIMDSNKKVLLLGGGVVLAVGAYLLLSKKASAQTSSDLALSSGPTHAPVLVFPSEPALASEPMPGPPAVPAVAYQPPGTQATSTPSAPPTASTPSTPTASTPSTPPDAVPAQSTPSSPTSAPATPAATSNAIPYDKDVATVQTALKMAGYDPGTIDGQLGPQTTAALKRFQTDHGIEATGMWDAATGNALAVAIGQPPPYGTYSPSVIVANPYTHTIRTTPASGT